MAVNVAFFTWIVSSKSVSTLSSPPLNLLAIKDSVIITSEMWKAREKFQGHRKKRYKIPVPQKVILFVLHLAIVRAYQTQASIGNHFSAYLLWARLEPTPSLLHHLSILFSSSSPSTLRSSMFLLDGGSPLLKRGQLPLKQQNQQEPKRLHRSVLNSEMLLFGDSPFGPLNVCSLGIDR